MGRKSFQELQESQLLSNSELLDYLSDSLNPSKKNKVEEFAFNLYQFTKLIYDNTK
jgi:hypothetical protein